MDNLNNLYGSNFANNWTKDVTHVVMTDIILTVKVVNALAKGVPIVTPNYFIDVLTCANTKQAMPLPENYLPPMKEAALKRIEVSCAVNLSRQSVFQNKTFVFFSSAQMKKYDEAIEYASGKCVVFNHLSSPDAKNDNLIVIQPSASDIEDEIRKKFLAELKKRKRRLIPEHEIGLAIVKTSCEVDCNPEIKKDIFVKPSTPVVKEVNNYYIVLNALKIHFFRLRLCWPVKLKDWIAKVSTKHQRT